jgi:hypothetical protein
MTQEQRDWLEKNGLDPTVYDIDAEGNVFENPVERMSKTRAALTSAAASTLPSLGGLAAAVPGMKVGAIAGAPFGGPVGSTIGSVIGGMVTGFGGSYLTGKAQEAALERYAPEAIEQIARAQEEQPVASFVGGVAPTALTMRPTTQGLSGLLRPTVRGTTLREAVTRPEFVAPASNVAANIAQSAAGQALKVAQGGDFSPAEFAAETAIGTLFNRPTRLGRKLGLPDLPEVPQAQKTDLERARLMAERPEEFVTPREERLGIGREKVAPEQFFGTEMDQRNRPVSEERAAKEYANWWKSETEPTADLIKQAAESVKIKIPRERINELANDPDVARVINDPTTLPEFVAKQSQDALQDAYENAAKQNQAAKTEEMPDWMRPAPEDVAKAETIQKQNEEAGLMEEGMAAQELLNEQKKRRNKQGIAAAREIYNDIYSRFQRGEGEPRISQADIDAAAQIAARRGLKIELDRAYSGSREVRGVYMVNPDTGDRIVRVNPLMATPDTAIHEIGHDVFRGVTNPSMRKSLLETAIDTPAFKSEMAARQAEVDQGLMTPEQARNIALEEGVIQAFGEQMPNINRSELRSWFQAFKASTKQLVTGRLSPDDAIAWLHYASTEAVPWKGVAAPKATEQRMQRDEQPQTISERRAAAFERFKQSTPGSQAEMMESGRIFSPDVRAKLEALQAGGTLDREALQAAINRDIPVRKVAEFSTKSLPDFKTIRDSLSDPRKKANVGKLNEIPAGSEMTLRQDVPAMTDFGVGVVTGTSGDITTYEPFIRVRNIKMVPTKGMETQSLKIGAGAAKNPAIVAKGIKHELQTIPSDINTWTQVGFNPDRHSYFYDRADGVTPILGGDEAVQIGNTVFVKNPQTGDSGSFRFQRGEEKTRKFAERVAASEQVPSEVRRVVAGSPEAQYIEQSVRDEASRASIKSDRELAADIIDPESNTRVISGMEQFNRQIASGDMDGASKTALSLSKSGTTWGQLINQFKLLKSASREGVIQLVTKSLEQNKRKPMTPKQAEQLGTAMDQYKIAQDAATAARVEGRTAFGSNNPADIQSALDRINVADTLRMEADVVLNETIARINPSSAADLFVSLVQGSVMAPISIVRNVVGNAINLPLRETADLTSSLIDMALFGSKNNAYNYRSRLLDRIKAFGQSLPAAQKAILRGSNANPYELGTSIGNPLNFQRAWKNLYEAMSGEYRGNVARNIVEATVGVMPDIMLRLTQATDIPFKQANRAAIVSELGRMRGLTESQIKLALKDPELALISDQARANGRKGFTADDINTIETEAARSVFQQDNSATRMVAGINRFIKQETGSFGYVPYRLISLFQKTPINVAAEALQFTPAGVLRDWGNMSVRDREQAVGRLIVGSMVMGAFSYLYDKGIVTPNLDTPGETNKARELAKAGGVMPPGTLNVSALRRLTAGQDPSFQPGDTVKDLSALGTMGALGIIVGSSKRIAERSRTDEPDFFALGKGSALSGINFVMEQQFLKGTSDLIKLMSEESGASLERFVKNLAVTAASPIAPSTLGSIRRAEREYLPVTGGEGIIKDTVNELNQRFAALGLAIPGTKDPNAMPVRRDLWGEAVEQTPKGNNPWVYQFLSFAKNREIDADPLNASIYRVWRRTADNKALPSVPNPQLTYKNQTFERMTPEQYDRYAQLVGFYRRKFSERAFMSGAYQQRGDESRIKLLSEAYDNGLKLGKLRFLKELRESGQTLTPVAPRRGFEE